MCPTLYIISILSVSFDTSLESLIDFKNPECSEVCVDSNLWADLDLSSFEEPEKYSETLNEFVFLNERQEEGDCRLNVCF